MVKGVRALGSTVLPSSQTAALGTASFLALPHSGLPMSCTLQPGWTSIQGAPWASICEAFACLQTAVRPGEEEGALTTSSRPSIRFMDWAREGRAPNTALQSQSLLVPCGLYSEASTGHPT